MVRIDPITPAVKTRSTEKARKTSKSQAKAAASFAQSLSEAAEVDSAQTTETAVATAEAAGDAGLLALQEKGKLGRFDPERTKKKAIAYGEGLIERLQALHVRLLSGVVSEAELLHLEAYFADADNGAALEDEKLRSILDEIELRVQVELAKKRR